MKKSLYRRHLLQYLELKKQKNLLTLCALLPEISISNPRHFLKFYVNFDLCQKIDENGPLNYLNSMKCKALIFSRSVSEACDFEKPRGPAFF